MKAATLLQLLLASLWAVPARAHAILIDSTPPIHGTVPPGYDAITLKFNSRIDRERSRLTLITADKTQTKLPIVGDGPADIMTATADLTPGDYTVRWQVLAVDGHITRGDVPFTVADPQATRR
jgi:methionine-rich copper-binding protein CopC